MLPNLPELFVIFSLIVVIVIQVIDKHAANEQSRLREKELIAAVLSKNVMDFTVATEKIAEKPKAKLASIDEVDLTNATDDVFDKFIEEQNK
jgi:uncharacterized membrane protein YsdA (DUF1294 family)